MVGGVMIVAPPATVSSKIVPMGHSSRNNDSAHLDDQFDLDGSAQR